MMIAAEGDEIGCVKLKVRIVVERLFMVNLQVVSPSTHGTFGVLGKVQGSRRRPAGGAGVFKS